MVRRRRRAAVADDDGSTMSSAAGAAGGGVLYISDNKITSRDQASSPPDQPLHENSTFPTRRNVSNETASALCLSAVQQTPLYDDCLNFTTIDTQHYLISCVDDIKVATGCSFYI